VLLSAWAAAASFLLAFPLVLFAPVYLAVGVALPAAARAWPAAALRALGVGVASDQKALLRQKLHRLRRRRVTNGSFNGSKPGGGGSNPNRDSFSLVGAVAGPVASGRPVATSAGVLSPPRFLRSDPASLAVAVSVWNAVWPRAHAVVPTVRFATQAQALKNRQRRAQAQAEAHDGGGQGGGGGDGSGVFPTDEEVLLRMKPSVNEEVNALQAAAIQVPARPPSSPSHPGRHRRRALISALPNTPPPPPPTTTAS
jgi:hypothetical protein